MQTGTILWQPDPKALEKGNFHAFLKEAEKAAGKPIGDFTALHAWSVSDLEGFWSLVWDFCGVIGEKEQQQPRRKCRCRVPGFSPKPG